MRKSTSFVTENVVNSTQFLRNLAVSSYWSLNRKICIDSMRKNSLGNVKIDSHTDRNYAGKQQNLSKNIQKPIFPQASAKNSQNREYNHENK